jgi:hypothetical protein
VKRVKIEKRLEILLLECSHGVPVQAGQVPEARQVAQPEHYRHPPKRGKVLAQNFGALSWVWAMEARAGDHGELAAALYSQDARIRHEVVARNFSRSLEG